MFAPSGNTEKYLRFLAALSVIAVMISPLKELSGIDLTLAWDNETMAFLDTATEQEANSHFVERCCELISSDIETVLEEKFALKDCTVELEVDKNDILNVKINEVKIKINVPLNEDEREYLAKEISEMMLCEVYVYANGNK